MKRRNWISTIRLLWALFISFLPASAYSQSLLLPDKVSAAMHILQNAPSGNSLGCKVDINKNPRLDFSFRYSAHFWAECPAGVLRPGSVLLAIIRITPEGKEPVFMSQEFHESKNSSSAGADFNSTNSGQMEWTLMGGFALGAGTYSIDVLFTDPQAHVGRKTLKLSVPKLGAGINQPILGPGQVAALSLSTWDGKFAPAGPRLTVLLNANSERGSLGGVNIAHPGASIGEMISAYDPAYLLTILDSLLSRLSCSSVTLVAYDVDRQIEVFREENVIVSTFGSLEAALLGRELQTIDVGALQNGSREDFLYGLIRKEVLATKRPDIVLLLGEPIFLDTKIPGSLAGVDTTHTRFFYLKSMNYSSRLQIPYRDGIQQLIKLLHGTTLTFDSPETFTSAIEKVQQSKSQTSGNDAAAAPASGRAGRELHFGPTTRLNGNQAGTICSLRPDDSRAPEIL
jgi:hypothetical protein